MTEKRVARRAVPKQRTSPESRRVKEVDGGLFTNVGRCEVVLGIDQSYTGFGITAMALDGAPIFHSWCYKAPNRGISRLRAIDYFLYEVLERLTCSDRPVKAVAMEGYAFGTQMANMAGELGATVKLCLANYFGIDAVASPGFPLIVPPTSLKKYALGKGNAVGKQHILLGIYKKWGVEFRDDNMADAYVLAQISRHRNTEAGLLAYELAVLATLRDPKHRETGELV